MITPFDLMLYTEDPTPAFPRIRRFRFYCAGLKFAKILGVSFKFGRSIESEGLALKLASYVKTWARLLDCDLPCYIFLLSIPH